MTKVAVIDMGTNTFHLLLVKITENGFHTIFQEKIPVKIGQKGISQNLITTDAQKRALDTLRHFKTCIEEAGITQVHCFATSAVRNAQNQAEFVSSIHAKLGFNVQVIDGNEEATLIYEGILLSGAVKTGTPLMMDIGGGSVEFIIGSQEKVLWKQSFEIGGQRLLDKFHSHDPILESEVEALHLHLKAALVPLIQAIRQYQPTGLIGASGTFDTLNDIYIKRQGLEKDRREPCHILPLRDFESIAEDLTHKTREERLAIPGMISLRVDMIVVALCLIRYVLKHIEVEQITCSNYSLKEGVIHRILQDQSQILLEK